MNLLTIAEEAAACREAWAGKPVGTSAWHIHHERLLEWLTEPAENRIAYILAEKPTKEQALRLRLFRPVEGALPEALVTAGAAYDTAGAAYDTARAAYDTAGPAYDTAWAAYDTAGAAYVKARAAYVKAWAAYVKARAAYDTARAAYDTAGAAYVKARAAYAPVIEALHATEHPDCPWNGRSIL